MPPSNSSWRCLRLLRQPIRPTFASPARRFLQTQSHADQQPSRFQSAKASSIDKSQASRKEYESSALENDTLIQNEPEDLGVPELSKDPGWILPIPERPRRQLVSKRSEYLVLHVNEIF